ncbi:MAG: PilZ domain-containing protein [Acidobacteriia bacterium]|nr:PilZ domain-containing protein [Terriglobia bacterium]
MNERRKARRYNLSLPIVFRIRSDKESSTRNSRTRDVSTQGVYFTIEEALPAGTALDVVLTLPSNAAGPSALVRAICRVVRVDTGSSRDYAAAVIENYAFVREETGKINLS